MRDARFAAHNYERGTTRAGTEGGGRGQGKGEKSRLPELLRERDVRDRDLNEARENAGGKSPGGEERNTRAQERERER